MAKKSVNRTVQYWRLVDGATGEHLDEEDWDSLLRRIEGAPEEQIVSGVAITGRSYRLSVTDHWHQSISVSDIDDAIHPADPKTTFGLVLASPKDFIPNQQDARSGDQRALSLAGDDWFPVDNLFVWFLPFGNMIGVLAESVSSSRAATLADWLTKVTQNLTGDTDFSWRAVPVIDQERAQILRRATGLRSFDYAGEIGEAVVDATAARSIFGRGRSLPKAIRIEIKASLVNGKSDFDDQELLLDWFNDKFGSLDGKVTKAQAVVAADADIPRTEIDLIQQRLTRKTKIPINLGVSRAFTPLSAVGAVIDAFVKDRADLLRLRNSEE